MPKRRQPKDDYDSPWKDALQAFFPAFLALLFPDIHADIDWTRGYEPLDKEFQQIVRQAKVGKRLADKLFKVWLRDGEECWVFIHVEIQAEPEKEFGQRMFDYNSAVRKLYNHEVVSLAVLCDDRPDWRPTRFAYGRWGCRMELTFRIAKLLDQAAKVAELEVSNNPMAIVVLAHLETLQTRDDPADRRVRKLRLVKGLFRRNFSTDDIRELFRLIDWLMAIPDELEEAFQTDVYEIEKEKKVEFMSGIERIGFKKGLEEGLEKGLEKGRETGERAGLLEGIELSLEVKFAAAGRKLFKKIRTLNDIGALRQFGQFLKKAKTLDEVREYLG